MNDCEYVFAQDVREKKIIAHGAKHKVGRRSGCTLPSDGMSAYQRKKLNGPVQNWNIHEPLSWGAFKGMPADLQQAHLAYISERFRVGVTEISVEVFGLARASLGVHCTRNQIETPRPQKGRTPKAEDLDALRKWLKGEGEEPAEAAEPTCESAIPLCVKGMTLHLEGSAEEITQGLQLFLSGRGASVEVEIKFK